MKNFLAFFMITTLFALPAQAQDSTETVPTETIVIETKTETTPQQEVKNSFNKPYRTNWFFQMGANVGYELDYFKTVSPGVSLGIGYQWNQWIGTYVRSEFYFHNQDGAGHYNFNLIPSIRFAFFDNLYGFFGVGFNYLHAREGSRITEGTRNFDVNYKNVTLDAGLGYTYFIKDSWGLWGEAGVNYIYFNSQNFPIRSIVRPNLRLGASYRF